MKKDGFDRRREKAAQTRVKLYAAADRLFAQYGFDKVSVDAIVEEAGVSKGAFYVHFESKDGLAAALITDYVDKADMDYRAFLDAIAPNEPAVNILLALVAKIFDVIENDIGCDRIRVLYKVQLAGASHAQTASGYSRALYQMLGDVLGRGVSRGEFKASPPVDELARHLILAMRGLTYEWCIRYPDFDLSGQARKHFEILLEGIRSGK